ncbi:hypothetical protein C0J52_06671 [Blattella germanica]|nr:hypothetical protein C0J52_06671 [Blattella germanica]
MVQRISLLFYIVFIFWAINADATSNLTSEEKWSKAYHRYQNLYKNSFYLHHPERVKWMEAVNACSEEGSHLVVVNSQAESEVISKFMTTNSITAIFAGFHDMFFEGEYITITGQTLEEAGFSTWHVREPDEESSGVNQDCGVVFYDGRIGDLVCEHNVTFICEYEM